MVSRPSTYAAAAKLGPDGAACLSLALDVWLRLTLAQQSAVRRVRFEPMMPSVTGWHIRGPVHARVLRGLGDCGVALGDRTRGYWLTPLGLLVREAGLAHDVALARGKNTRRGRVRVA